MVLQNRAQLVFVHALSWGRQTAEPLKKVHENGFFEMNKLIIKVEVKIVQAFDERDVSGREMVDSNGFQFLCTQKLETSGKHLDLVTSVLPELALIKEREIFPLSIG
ncbi:hypothetical protein Bca52824_076626 [Brassica carinata]|uniref:Uncharacterized protein n=1 Tax=Brassica carinata TaxID=52824 RepID=A0A8X7PUB3_BRACI|nr:hypothetical protein Bca52824_076626 [Brassica carinata]